MRKRSQRRAAVGCLATAISLGLAGCADRPASTRTGEERANAPAPRLPAIRAQFPSARTDGSDGASVRLYGTALATGAAPAEAANNFKQSYATAMGLPASDLVAEDVASGQVMATGAAQGIGLMYDQPTGQPRFWLYRYKQFKDGLPVFRAGLRTLVRNDRNNTVVWAASTVRDLSRFSSVSGLAPRTPDVEKSLLALQALTGFAGQAMAAPTALKNVSQPEVVIFAGTEDAVAEPRLAIQYTADTSPVGKWQFVADAATGDVLHVESQLVFANVTGSVTARVTQGDVAMECAPEVATPFAFAEVDGLSGESTFSDAGGSYVLSTSASGSLQVTSVMGGKYFDITTYGGTLEQLVSAVVPPGPADFLHDSTATDPLVMAQVNGYSNANEIRAFLLRYLPTYPVIASQLNFPVRVNLTSTQTSTCPGNAFYDGSALNLCQGSASYTNTSFASVTHHEYGHHIINSAGSGQGAYGEGMSDSIAALFAGQAGLAFGFYLNQCTTPLRNADNTCQYSASSCSSCGSDIHTCGQLMSGIIWSIRKNLAVSHPDTYVDLINTLTLSSILVHTGTGINAQIAIDLLTLDDDDGNINNGTPHDNEICSGFSAHGLSCPPGLPPVNHAPAVNAGPDQTITLPAAARLTGTVSDDGLPNPPGLVTSTWSIVSGPGVPVIGDPTAPSTTVTFSATGSYVIRLTASDSALSSTDDITITVNPASPTKQAPVVNAGPDQTITLPASASLVGTATDDGLPNPPGVLTTTWSTASGPGTVICAGPYALSPTCSFSAPGVYVIRLTASDGQLSSSDDIVIVVNPAPTNNAPIVNAGPDQTVSLTVAAILAGTATDDGLPNPPAQVTTTWSKVSGPGTVTFASASALAATATFSAQGTYTLRLTASDSELSSTDDIIITVSGPPANRAPVVNAGPDQTITLPTANLVGTATDDGLPNPPAKMTTTWSKVSGPGTVTFANASALATTATFSVAGSYVLRLTGSDSVLSATDDVAITVNAAGNTPCTGLCSNPVNFTINGSYPSGNLGTGAVCYQTTSSIHGGNCGNFASPRTLKVNAATQTCNGGNWASVPAKRNGGYCIQATAGNYAYAYFTTW